MNNGIENKPVRRTVFIPCGDSMEKMPEDVFGIEPQHSGEGEGAMDSGAVQDKNCEQ